MFSLLVLCHLIQQGFKIYFKIPSKSSLKISFDFWFSIFFVFWNFDHFSTKLFLIIIIRNSLSSTNNVRLNFWFCRFHLTAVEPDEEPGHLFLYAMFLMLVIIFYSNVSITFRMGRGNDNTTPPIQSYDFSSNLKNIFANYLFQSPTPLLFLQQSFFQIHTIHVFVDGCWVVLRISLIDARFRNLFVSWLFYENSLLMSF